MVEAKRRPMRKVSSDYSSDDSDSSNDDNINRKSKAIKKKEKKEGVVNFDDSDDGSEEERPPKINFYKAKKRAFTISIVVPSSIIDNAQSFELKTYLVGQIAKACGLF